MITTRRVRLRPQLSHPLNQGLVAWWLAQPWMFTGDTLYTMVGDAHGVMREMGVQAMDSGFGSTARQGGYGELRFNGTTDQVSFPVVPLATNLFSLSLWVSFGIRGDGYSALVAMANGNGLYLQTAGGSTRINYYDGASHGGDINVIPIQQWTHIAAVSTGEAMLLYMNGLPDPAEVYTPSIPAFTLMGNSPLVEAFPGMLDDIRIYNRMLSSAEVSELSHSPDTRYRGLISLPRRWFPSGGINTRTVDPARQRWRSSAVGTGAIPLLPGQVRWRAGAGAVSRDVWGTFVQSVSAELGDGPVQSLMYTNPVTRGSTLVVVLRFGSTPGTVTVTDTFGNTYVRVNVPGATASFQCFYVESCLETGPNLVTITISAIVGIRAILAEYEGSSVLHVSSDQVGNGTALDSGNLVTTSTPILLIGTGRSVGVRTFTPGGSFTGRDYDEDRMALEDRLVLGAGTYTASMTLNAVDDWAMIGAAFSQGTTQRYVVTPATLAWSTVGGLFNAPRILQPARMQWRGPGALLSFCVQTQAARVPWRLGGTTAVAATWGLHVQSIGAAIGDGPVQSLAYPQPVQTGNTLFLAARFGNTPGTITITDTLGNTWLRVNYTVGVLQFECFYAPGCVATGANTVTITIENTVSMHVILAEYAESSGLHASSGATGVGTGLTSGNLVVTQLPALVLGAGGVLGTALFTPGSGLTERQEVAQRLALEDRLLNATATYVADMEITASTEWAMVGVVFVPQTGTTVQPARLRWVAQGILTPIRRTISPTHIIWRAQALRRPGPPVSILVSRMRRLVQPRIRYAPIRGLQQGTATTNQLALWYLAQPWQFPGQQWVDMVAGTVGTFLNMPVGNGLAGWHPRSHPGGRGSMGFDGSAQAIQLAASPAHSLLTQMTLCAWVYPYSYGSTNKARILDKTGIAAHGGWYLGLQNGEGAGRAVEFGMDGKTLLMAVSQNAVVDLRTWTHITVVWTGTFTRADIQFYINGMLVATQGGAIGQEGQGPATADTTYPLYIGNRDALDRGFDGLLDDLRLYTRALTPVAVQALYTDSLTGAFGGLAPTMRLVPIGQAPPTGTVFLLAEPARWRYQPSVTLAGRTGVVTPSRLRWAAQAVRSAGPLLVTPARIRWCVLPGSYTTPNAYPTSPGMWPMHKRPRARKPALGTPLQRAHPLVAGLLACWAMNEGQGPVLADATGLGHDAVMGIGAGTQIWVQWVPEGVPGYPGPAIQGNYGGDVTSDPASNILQPVVIAQGEAFTIELWVYLENRFPANSTFGWVFHPPSPAQVPNMDCQGPSIIWHDGAHNRGIRTRLHTWSQVVFVRRFDGTVSGSNLALLDRYLNGFPQEGISGDAPTVAGNDVLDTAIEWTQFLHANNLASPFMGKMALARIWNRALTGTEVAQLYTDPFGMFATQDILLRSGAPPVPPTQVRWHAQTLLRVSTLLPSPTAQMQWSASRVRATGTLSTQLPSMMRWSVTAFPRTIQIEPTPLRWRTPQQRWPLGLNLRDAGDAYVTALSQTMVGGDWLIQAPDIGLKVSFNYEVGGGWEHRIVDISDIELSVTPGGGMASAANVTVTIAESQRGQSILQLWEQAVAVESVEVTIDFLLAGETSALRIFTGRIDSVIVKDALTQLLLVDDSISKNLLIPPTVVTSEDFPNADQAVLTRAIPLVYGQGSTIGAAPLLFVDVPTNTYLVANHPMRLGGKLAVYDQPTKSFLTLDAVVFIPNNGTASITLGTLNTGVLQVTHDGTNGGLPGNALDGNSLTRTVIPTWLAGPNTHFNILYGDGYGFAGWSPNAPGMPMTGTIKVDLYSHRRSPGSDPTVTGQVWVRTISPDFTTHMRFLFTSPAFNHVTSAQHNTFIISNISIGINEVLQVMLIARCQNQIGGVNQTYEIGEVSITPLVAFSANISGTPTAIGMPINIQELRFNPQRPALSVYTATNVTNAANAIDGSSLTIAQIGTGSIDSNLDGYGELIVTTSVTSAQRSNNTVSIDLARHRRSLDSTPTVTGTFMIQTYNTNTGVLLRDNLLVTQAFRHQLNPLTTSYVATAINLGATATLAVRLLARNEGGAGGTGQVYEVGEIGVETFYQPRGDSGDVFLYGAGYEGRTDPDGTVTTYIGTVPGRLLHTPDMVLASLLIQEVGLFIDLSSFATAYNFFAVNGLVIDGGVGAGWAVERTNARDILRALARQSTAILFPTFAATWGVRPFRATTAVHRTFDASTILTEYGSEQQRTEDRSSTLQVTLGNLQDVYNHFEVRYKYNVGSQKYDGVWKVTKDGSNLPADFPEKAAIEATCYQSWLRYGDLEPLIEEAYWLADDFTAAYYLRHLALYFAQQRITVQFETTFKAVDLQLGDFITVTDRSLPSGDNGGVFEVHTLRYLPMRGRIQLVASRVSQVPDVPIPDPPAALTGCARFAHSSGLLACWDFDEASGTRTDHIAELQLTEGNGPLLGVAGKVGQAVRFTNASSQYLENPNALVGVFTGAFTLACWVKMRDYTPGGFWGIVSNDDPTLGYPNREIFVGLSAGGYLHVGVGYANGGGQVDYPTFLPLYTADDWTLVRVWRTFDSTYSGVLSVQMNNGVVVTSAFTNRLPVAQNGFTLGAGWIGGVRGYFAHIDLDQLMIWNRVLSQAELDALWNGGLG